MIDIYESPLFTKWIKSFRNSETSQRIYNRLRRVQLGNFGDYKSIGNGIFELRLHIGPGYRIYYGYVGKQIILLLVGGSKKSQSKDIKKAKHCLQEYKNK